MAVSETITSQIVNDSQLNDPFVHYEGHHNNPRTVSPGWLIGELANGRHVLGASIKTQDQEKFLTAINYAKERHGHIVVLDIPGTKVTLAEVIDDFNSRVKRE